MSQAGALTNNSSVATLTFIADTGSANPSVDIINVFGDTKNIATAATGNTITISYVGSAAGVTDITGTAPIQANGFSGSPQTGNVTLSVTNATTSSVGVASFNTSNFTVSTGAVSSKALTLTAGTGLSGGGSVNLGGSVTLSLSTPVSGANGGTGHTNTGLTIDLVTGAGSGKVLTSDGSGNASWSSLPASGVTSLTGTSNQIAVSASTGAVTVSFPATAGLSVGSYQPTTAPVGGMILPGRVGIGTLSPDSSCLLETSLNGAAYIFSTSYGTNIGGQVILRGARGSQASPSAPLLNDLLGTFGCRGYQSDTLSFSGVTAAGFSFINGQNGFLSTTNAMSIEAFTTDQGSVTPKVCCQFTFTQDVLIGVQSISSSATQGFAWIASASGQPTGTPGSYAGYSPLYYDLSNHKLWVYDSGSAAWRGVVLS